MSLAERATSDQLLMRIALCFEHRRLGEPMGFWSTLFGKGKEAAAPSPAPVRELSPRWGEIEVQGESFRRDAVRRLFDELGLPAGGVTQQTAHLEPEPSNPGQVPWCGVTPVVPCGG